MEKAYLFILKSETNEQCEKAFHTIRKLGHKIPAQYSSVALEVIAPIDEAEKLFKLGFFVAYSDQAFPKDQIALLSKTQQVVVELWNHRFSTEFQNLQKDTSSRNVRWGSKGYEEPAPYTMFNVVRVKKKLANIVKTKKSKDSKQKSTLFPSGAKVSMEKLRASDISLLESSFAKVLKSSELGYHAARLWYYLTKSERETIAELDNTQILEIFATKTLPPEEPFNKWTMHGRISVGIVIVESSLQGGPRFTPFERGSILNRIFAGLNFLTSQHPTGNLSWVFDFQFVDISVANQDNGRSSSVSYDSYWMLPGLHEIHFNGMTFPGADVDTAVFNYRKALRETHRSRHAITLLVTPYGTSYFAYSAGKFIALSPHGNNWGGHGLNNMDMVVAHETCHNFTCPDEYADPNTQGTICTNCNDTFGADQIPNGNCEACARPGQGCLMVGNQPYLCEYTKGHIGWADLFVELFTSDADYAGTDDKVWLDIGDKSYVLDSSHIDDRERNGRQGYALWAGRNLQPDAIKRILIRKDHDGSNGGWKLQQVKVYYGGQVLSDDTPNIWLEDDTRWWLGPVFNPDIVNWLQIKVTTANEANAGTDDTVTLEIAGHVWRLNTPADDFQRGATNTFNLDPQTGFYPDQITNLTIKKAPDGDSGAWKLKGIQLFVNNVEVYNNQSINTWLKGNNLTWTTTL